MKYGINIPNFGYFSDPNCVVEIAKEAENAGWDGFFLWDHINGDPPFADPWVLLSAIAANTEKMNIGPIITPLPRRRPWVVARQAVTLDHLSQGRLILGVGLGNPPDSDFEAFGEISDNKIRAEKLDEGLDILTGLLSGKKYYYDGKHYQVKECTFLPQPYNKKNIPIFVGGAWPNKAPFRRAAKFDGVVPIAIDWTEILTVNDVEAIIAYVRKHRTSDKPFDVMIGGSTSPDWREGVELVQPYIEAGGTWWSEDINEWRASIKELRERIRAGPPRE